MGNNNYSSRSFERKGFPVVPFRMVLRQSPLASSPIFTNAKVGSIRNISHSRNAALPAFKVRNARPSMNVIMRRVLSVQSQLVSDRRSHVLITRRSGHEVLPLSQCGRAAGLVCLAIDEVALQVEVVVDVGMDRGELLKRFHLPKS